MSIAATPVKRSRLPAIAAVAVLGSFLLASLASDGTSGKLEADRSGIPAPIVQAKWKVTAFPAGGKLRAGTRATFKRVSTAAAGVVTQVFDSLYTEPDRTPEVAARTFTRKARAALLSSDAGIPEAMERVKIVLRSARVGVQAEGLKRAAASVRLRLRGRLDGKRARIAARSTLWLERSKDGWRVIAFDIEQGRPR